MLHQNIENELSLLLKHMIDKIKDLESIKSIIPFLVDDNLQELSFLVHILYIHLNLLFIFEKLLKILFSLFSRMPVQRRGMRALEIWCQRVTSSYSNVDVSDLSTSFRDGLAFCAIIHHFRPELIDYESLNPDKMLENNSLAFKVAIYIETAQQISVENLRI